VRLLRPSLIVFCLALLASLSIHLPIYEVLGSLAKILLKESPPAAQPPVEFEIGPVSPKPPEHPPKAVARADKPDKQRAEKRDPKKTQPSPQELAKPKLVEAQPAPELPRPADRPLAVTQKSEDPNQPPPDNARFIAEDNRKVEQESVARIRNMQRDDSEPVASAEERPNDEHEQGDSAASAVADQRDVKGSDERTATPTEAQTKPVAPSQPSAGSRRAEAVPRAASEATPSPPAQAPAERAPGAPAPEPDTIVVEDGVGSFTIRKQPHGGPGQAEARNQNPGQPGAVRSNRPGQTAREGANLEMSWSQFEETFGSAELQEQRAAYVEQRRSKAAGGERQRMWREFRAAIENFVPDVQPGRQTALNAAADPFAQYLAVVHRRIHREFAFGFLRSLPLVGGPFGDPNLHTELEIVINGDGNIHRVGIAQSSGFLPFDYGAFNAVMRAAPYATPPRKILSGDGRVYVHWGFYRNERQCGTFNARPYILPHPPGSPKPQGPLRDDDPRPRGPVVTPDEGELGLRTR
jgi:hypothetical protein